jgi:hypothetical protein
MGVTENMPNVQRSTDGWGRSINGKDLITGFSAVKGIGASFLPGLGPLFLNPGKAWLFWNIDHWRI